MRILMFGMSSYPGGIENYIYNYFVNDQTGSSIIVDFVTYEPTIAYEDKLKEHGYTVHRVPHLKKNPIGYFKSVKAIINANKYDCVYINMLTAANILPVVLSCTSGVKKIVLHAHANSTVKGLGRRFLHRLNKGYCNKKATLRLACSKEAGKWLFDDREFYIIPNAIDCRKFSYSKEYRKAVRDKLGIYENQTVIGHIGRLAEEKNHFFMLEILQCILRLQPDSKMIFVGDGRLAEAIRQRTQELKLQDSVIFYGTTDRSHQIYSAFDYFLFPSTFEGFGMAALEAQSCGIQVFCSDTLSDELNVSGSVKYLSLKDGADKWADEILKTKKADPDILNEAVKKSDYNIEKQIERLLRLLYE